MLRNLNKCWEMLTNGNANKFPQLLSNNNNFLQMLTNALINTKKYKQILMCITNVNKWTNCYEHVNKCIDC